jgi:EAL domain-containing protein (putative c-di-GMP-specific phosphodiesterase class I)/GGDEF domain-containing protein
MIPLFVLGALTGFVLAAALCLWFTRRARLDRGNTADEVVGRETRTTYLIGRPSSVQAPPYPVLAEAPLRTPLMEGLISGTLAGTADVSGTRPFVAVISIDGFAELRHRIGYTLAGQAVRELGNRVRSAMPGARLGRLGRTTIELGFGAPDVGSAEAELLRLAVVLEQRLDLGGHLLDLTVTIGFSGADDGDASEVDLIERAELALTRAQETHAKLTIFNAEDHADLSERLMLMRDLRSALARDEMFLCYQPKMRARTDEIDGLEALLRWRHPIRGVIPPDQFIPLAEETGEIRALTEWVLQQALHDQDRLREGGHLLTISVNISARLLADRDFASWALAKVRGSSGPIAFEVTETAMIEDPPGALRNLHAFAEAGIWIAIDDYGSGLSSLAYLKDLPANELKIDKMFISRLTSSHRDPLLVRSTIELAHALDMEVTAEGVDTPAALALLRVMGCDVIQGYLIARPVTIGEIERFLDDWTRATPEVHHAPSLSNPGTFWQQTRLRASAKDY